MDKKNSNTATSPERSRGNQNWFWLIPFLLLFMPLVTNEYQQYIINLMLIYVPVAIGFNLVTGNLGQLAFSNLAFFSAGAYTSGILSLHLGWPWWTTIVPAGLLAGGLGALVGSVALRGLRGFYLAIATLALGELMRWGYIHMGSLTGGAGGFAVPTPSVLGWELDSAARKFYVLLVIVVLIVVSTNRLLRSRFGRAIMGTKENEAAATMLGVPTSITFLATFAWSGFVVGVGGAGYAALVQYLSPEAFGLEELILQFALIMVGGLGSLAGSIIGAITVTALPELFRDIPGFQELMLGAAIALTILFLPHGLVSLLQKISPIFQDRYSGK